MASTDADVRVGNGHGATEAESLERLRALLLDVERARMARLERRVEALKLDPRELARELPQAIRLSRRNDGELSLALEEPVEDAIRRSVNKNPRVLTDAIFPLIGPAIRKAIRESLAALLEGFNTALEHSLTLRGLRWRIESWRTGRPFSEVVLLHCLVYRVEQLFLIHRDNGLLLEHVTGPRVPQQDPDMVSAMLTAIRDFVHDSFDPTGPEGELESVQVGGTELLIEPQPRLVLAALVRGRVPEDFRARLSECAEAISLEFANELADFGGDTAPFLLARAQLEPLLAERFVEGREPEGRRPRLAFALIATVALVAIAPLVVMLVARGEERGRWEQAFARLADEPGIVVVRVERRDGGYELHGLRDPDAADPLELLRDRGLDVERVSVRMEQFHSLEPEVVLARLRRRLSPPEIVELALDGPRLVARGRAPHAFVAELDLALRSEPGVIALDDSGLVDTDLERLEKELAALAELAVEFEPGSAQLDLERSGAVLAQRFGTLAARAAAAELDLLVRVVASPEPARPALEGERAAAVRTHLESLRLGPRLRFELAAPDAALGLQPEPTVRFRASPES